MATKVFHTNLNCGSCVAKVSAILDQDESIETWSVDTDHPLKLLTVAGPEVSSDRVREQVARAGFKVFEEQNEVMPHPASESRETRNFFQIYAPLFLILLYLLGGIGIAAWNAQAFHLATAMNQFMGGFFIIFSFFKLLNLKGFADSYQTYDLVAQRSRAHALFYPFLELTLGIAYFTHFLPFATYLVTLGVMGVSSIGVLQSVLQKRQIKCACLGTVFNLPMSTVTLVEDLLMFAMALMALIGHLT